MKNICHCRQADKHYEKKWMHQTVDVIDRKHLKIFKYFCLVGLIIWKRKIMKIIQVIELQIATRTNKIKMATK